METFVPGLQAGIHKVSQSPPLSPRIYKTLSHCSSLLHRVASDPDCHRATYPHQKHSPHPAQIEEHLIRRGFKKGYTCWTSHGEEQIIQEVNNDDIVEEVNNDDIAEEVNDMPDVNCAFDEDR